MTPSWFIRHEFAFIKLWMICFIAVNTVLYFVSKGLVLLWGLLPQFSSTHCSKMPLESRPRKIKIDELENLLEFLEYQGKWSLKKKSPIIMLQIYLYISYNQIRLFSTFTSCYTHNLVEILDSYVYWEEINWCYVNGSLKNWLACMLISP